MKIMKRASTYWLFFCYTNNMSIKTLALTGYKPHELNIFSERDQKIDIIKGLIERKLVKYFMEGLEWVVISGQQGVETWGFDVVQALKKQYDVKIAIIPPFLEQEKVWKEDKQIAYQEMISLADFYQPLMNKPYESPRQFFIKNKWLIEKTDACLIVYEEEYGGSPKYFYELAVQYQQKNNYLIDVINSFGLEEFARELMENDYY